METPPTELEWYVQRLRELMLTLNAPAAKHVLFGEHVEYGMLGLPCRLGELVAAEQYRHRFADLLSRGWDWINFNAVGMLGDTLVVAVELPGAVQGSARSTSVNMSGPTRAVTEHKFDLRAILNGDEGAG